MKHKSNDAVFRLTASALCLAAAYLLPFLTGQIQQIGKMLCPMHLPVLLCGMICGWQYGLAVGIMGGIPTMRERSSGAIKPTAVAMAFELAAYGVIAGLLCRALSKKSAWIYVSLIGAMLGGRIVWGGVSYLLAGLTHGEFPFSAFLAGAFINAVPGIVLQLVVIPPAVLALRKAGLTGRELRQAD